MLIILDDYQGRHETDETTQADDRRGNASIKMDDIQDMALAASQILRLFFEYNWFSESAGRLGGLVCLKVAQISPSQQEMLVWNDKAARSVCQKRGDELHRHSCKDDGRYKR